MTTVRSGWPENKQKLLPGLKPCWTLHEEMSADAGILYKGQRMVIPKSCQKDLLERLHSNHQGIEATIRRARDSIYWPGMTSLHQAYMIESCQACSKEKSPQQKETLRSHDIFCKPWAKVGIDLYTYANATYLIVVDYYSDFFEFTNLERERKRPYKNAKSNLDVVAYHKLYNQMTDLNSSLRNSKRLQTTGNSNTSCHRCIIRNRTETQNRQTRSRRIF